MAVTAQSLAEIVRGPAVIQFDGKCFFSRDGINIRSTLDILTQEADCGPDVKLARDFELAISLRPESFLDNLGVVFPMLAMKPGDSCGALAKPLTVNFKNGKSITFPCAWVSSMPSLDLSGQDQPFGQMEFKVRADASGNIYDIGGGSAAAGLVSKRDLSTLCPQCFEICWAGSGGSFASFDSMEGAVSLDFNIQKEECRLNCAGLVDETFKSLQATLRMNVAGPTCADIFAALGIEGADAACRILTGQDLVLKGADGMRVTLFGAALTGFDMGAGKNIKGGGTLTWQACGNGDYPLVALAA